MTREWKPGDVALTFNGEPITFFYKLDENDRPTDEVMFTNTAGFQHPARRLAPARKAVVIDPEDSEQVERLAIAYTVIASARSGDEYRAWENRSEKARDRICTDLAAALREFANPTPPKPDEPSGLGALVTASYEDGDGKRFGPATWARGGDGTWVCLTDGLVGHVVPWPFLRDVEVTS